MFIKQIYTQAAAYKYSQSDLLSFIQSNMDLNQDRRLNLFFKKISKSSFIQTRYSCLSPEYFTNNSCLQTLSTGQRQKLYEQSSDNLIQSLIQKNQISDHNIQNLITISCTGYQTPGLDFNLIKYLNLPQSVFRYNLGSMGCYAGIIGLRLANNLNQNTFMLCLELCSLHFQSQPTSFSSITSNALFADGAALICLSPQEGEFELIDFFSFYLQNTLDKMSWLLRDTGFIMGLDPEVPALVESHLEKAVEAFLNKHNLNISQINHWIIHPGGLGILQAVQKSLNLSPQMLEHSLSVLVEYGNMSSGTIFFVLDKVKSAKKNDKIILIAFGPGLSIEMALLRKT